MADVAYDLVPVIVRRQLHASLAGAVERHRPDDVRLLAAHVRAAGDQVDPAHALEVLIAATRADLARLAGDEACASAGAGLDLARRLGRYEAVDELATAYAEACELAGRVEDAFPAWVEAADSAGDPPTRARRLARSASVAWDLGRFDDAHGRLDAADHALVGVPACAESIDVEEIRIRFAARAGDLVGLEEGIARLADLGRTVGSRRSRAAMLFARMGLAYQTGRYVDGLGIADELLTLAHDRESPLMAEAMLRPLTAVHLSWGDLASARAVVEEGLRLARQIGVPAIETFQSSLLATADMLAGEWETALRRTLDARDLAQRVGFARGAIYALGTEAMLLARLGRLDEAADRVSEGQRLFGKWSVADRHVFALIDLAEGMVALGRHEVDHALEIATGKAAHHPSIPPLALAFLGEVQAAVGEIGGAQETASRLAGLGPGAPFPAALAAWVSGLAAGARRDPSSAIKALDALDRAIAGFADLGMPYEQAVAGLDRAPVRSAAGHPVDAIAADVAAALEVLDRLQAKPQADRARAMLRGLGHRPAAPSGDHEQRRLTGREEEVARLVGQGLSNAEVAERLFISSRTVSTHLQHIYRRLGLPSRTALIRYVLEALPASEVTSRGGRIRRPTDGDAAT